MKATRVHARTARHGARRLPVALLALVCVTSAACGDDHASNHGAGTPSGAGASGSPTGGATSAGGHGGATSGGGSAGATTGGATSGGGSGGGANPGGAGSGAS